MYVYIYIYIYIYLYVYVYAGIHPIHLGDNSLGLMSLSMIPGRTSSTEFGDLTSHRGHGRSILVVKYSWNMMVISMEYL